MKVNQEVTPESGQWRCAKCDTPLEAGEVELQYLGNSFTVGVLVCRHCRQALITEDMATSKMLEVEQLLEDK